MDSINDFATWQFWVACLFVSALVWFTKTMVGHVSTPTLDKWWFKMLLTGSNLLWGIITAIPPGFLKGESTMERIMLGVGVGFFSHFAYHFVLKRFGDKFGINPPGVEVSPPRSVRKTPAPGVPVERSEQKTDPDIKVEKSGGP